MDRAGNSDETARLHERVAELETALRAANATIHRLTPPPPTEAIRRLEDQLRQRTHELAGLNTRLQQEIVEHSGVEQRLRASERRLAESQRLAQIGSWEYDPATQQAAWSAELYVIYGQPPDTFVPHLSNILAHVPPEDHAIVRGVIEKGQRAVHPETYAHRVTRPDGSVRFVRGVYDRVTRPETTGQRVVGIVRDVTDERDRQAAMEQTLSDLRQFKDMVNRNPAVISIWRGEPDAGVEFISESIRQFGYTSADILSNRIHWPDLLHPDDRDRIAAEHKAHVAAGHATFPMIYRLRTAAGETRWIHEEVTALPSDRARRFQAMMLDVTATREAEHRFHDISALNEAIIAAAPVGIAACDSSGQCIFANPAMSLMTHAATDLLLRQNISVFTAWRQPQLLAAATATLMTGVSHSDVLQVPASFGRERWLEYSLSRFQKANEPHLLIVFHDITERRRAEEQLRQTEVRYRALAESIPDMIYMVEPDGRVLYANTRSASQFNLTPSAMIGKRQQDLFSPAVAERHCRSIRAVAESGTAFAVEAPDVLDTGRPVWIDTRLIPIRDPGGTVGAVLGISRDVTERRLMIMSLEESEKRYRQLFESMNEGCTLYDLVYDQAGTPVDVRITAINPAGEAIIGMRADTLIGRRASEMVPGNKPLFMDIYAALDKGGPPVSIETRLDFLNKQLFLSFTSPRKGMIACIYTDITARKEAEAQMIQYQQQLRHLAAEIAMAGEQERRRIAVELHDGLGQALVLCKMKLESVKSEAEGAALRRQIQSSVRLVEEAIRDTRSLTFQLSPPVLHEIGLTAAIEWLAEHLGEQHGMKILVTRKSAREPAAMAVRVILFQAVRELAFNAIKHAQATAIAIDIRTVRGHLAIKVKDDGAGFDVGTQRGGTRNGMGLFNIRERVQLIGGSMTIESQPGKGTWVMLVAPLEELPAEDGKGLGHEHPHRAM